MFNISYIVREFNGCKILSNLQYSTSFHFDMPIHIIHSSIYIEKNFMTTFFPINSEYQS